MAGPGLRPFLDADAPALAALFRDSVTMLAADYYDDDQLDAWASAAQDAEAFRARLASQLTLVALVGGAVAGFASLKDNALLDMLYVRPEAARQGVGSALADALEKLAAARGAAKIAADVSDAARDFFAHRGYVGVSRNTVTVAGEWLGNTTMTKELAPLPAQGRA